MTNNFGSIIKQKLLGKYVEIYQGDTHISLNGYNDYDVHDKSVIYGFIEDVLDDCLILKVKGKNGFGEVYINTWSIRTINEYIEGGITIGDIYQSASRISHLRKKQ